MADNINNIPSVEPRYGSDKIDIHDYIKSLSAEMNSIVDTYKRPIGGISYYDSGASCDTDGDVMAFDSCCYVCQGGTWQYVNGGTSYLERPEYQRGSVSDGSLSLVESDKGGYDYAPTPIYDKDGCTIIGYEPKIYAKGRFGYAETDETYPLTEDENCEPIYGELAGQKVRLFKVPSVATLPSFASFKGGLPNKHDPANIESNEGYVLMTGLWVEGIELPTNPPKPLCKDNPYTIVMAERTENNKTVIGSGIAISNFKGEIQGIQYAFPKIGVNSNDYFDRSINPSGVDNFRGGTNMDKAVYTIHSPDFHFRRPFLNATHAYFEHELYGASWRYGLYAEGKKPDSALLPTDHNKGARTASLLNHTDSILGSPKGKRMCLKGISYAPANTVLHKEDKFSYSLCNLYKESSVFAEFKGSPLKFGTDATSAYHGKNVSADGTSDTSFQGDGFNHEAAGRARAFRVTFMRDIPRQYGSLVSMPMIPLLQATSLNQTSIHGLVGDSYNNAFTVKRTSYVSDKVPQDITPNGFLPFDKGLGRILNFLLRPLAKVIGAKVIGDVPEDGAGDSRSLNGMLRDRFGAPIVGSDRYYPHVVKTNVWFWMNSDVNVDYRQTGSIEFGEVHRQRLKGLEFDSAFPDGTDWDKTYMNRFYALSSEPARWKMITRILLNFIFTFGVGLWFLIDGWWDVGHGMSQIGGGSWGLQTIGAVVAIAFGILKIVLGYTWIQVWVASDLDNKIIDSLLKLDLTKPDVKNPDGSFSMLDGRLRQVGEDNYFRFNPDLTRVNNIEIGYTMGDPYYTERCDVYDNTIVYSDPQVTGSQIDSWRNFKINNVYAIPDDSGQVKKLFTIQDKLYAHTTDNIISLQSGRNTMQSSVGTVYLGEGTLFGNSTPLYGGVVEGYGGLQDPNATVQTKLGYIFPDRDARKWFIFNSGLKEIGAGMMHFLENNGDFELLRHYPNYKNIDNKSKNGIGYSVGIDNRLDRIIITKIDYRPLKPITDIDKANLKDKSLFCDVSWTLSFDMKDLSAISFHTYKKLLYVWNRFDLYSFTDNKMMLHNIKGLFNCFDGEPHPFVVELIFALGENFKFESLLIDTEVQEYDGCKYYVGGEKTFNKLVAYNDRQSTLELNIKPPKRLDEPDSLNESFGTITADYKLRRWSVSTLFDKVKDERKSFFDCDCDPTVLKLNDNFDKGKRDIELRGNYLIVRLSSTDLKKNEKLLFKSAVIDTDYEIEG
jgi:hypothetical protein